MPDIEDTSTASVDSDAKFLEEEVEAPSDETPPEGSDETPPEEEEVEEEIGEQPSDDLPPSSRFSMNDLKTKYPDILKTFPSLRDIYYREKQFSEIFPSIQDARNVQENSEAFETARNDIFTGNGEKFFGAIKEVDAEKLTSFASNILPSLYKVSPEAHWAAAVPLLENVVRSFYNECKKSGNTEAAEKLSEMLFQDKSVAEGTKTYVKEKTKDTSIEDERKSFETERKTSFTNDVYSEASKRLELIVLSKKDEKLLIDPDGEFSEWMRRNLVSEIIKEVGTQMVADKDHMRYMDSLWEKAKRSGYTSDWKAKINDAYLARARQLVPSIRQKLVAEARGSSSRTATRKLKTVEGASSRREPSNQGRPGRGSGGPINPKSINYGKTSDEDILNDNITFK